MNVAILLKTWGKNQISQETSKTLNKLADNNYEDDFVIFYENNHDSPYKVMSACMNVCDFWSFKGEVIFTKLDQFQMLEKMVLPITTTFYIQDLEWLENFNYEENYRIYNSADRLVCRSQYHADAIEKYCHRKPEIIDLCSLINRLKQS